jgi:hypothetical protein
VGRFLIADDWAFSQWLPFLILVASPVSAIICIVIDIDIVLALWVIPSAFSVMRPSIRVFFRVGLLHRNLQVGVAKAVAAVAGEVAAAVEAVVAVSRAVTVAAEEVALQGRLQRNRKFKFLPLSNKNIRKISLVLGKAMAPTTTTTTTTTYVCIYAQVDFEFLCSIPTFHFEDQSVKEL